MDNFVVEINNLRKSFGTKIVLDGVNLKIKEGESYVVIGMSGTGKSVLIKCILGLLKKDSGTIKILGDNIDNISEKEKSKKLLKCGVLFQGGALFDSLNVIDNISFGLIHGYGINQKDAHEIATEKLKSVNLDIKIAKLYPSELSGGMQKRVALARAIATNPSIIFFDEPTTGLDPITSGTISDLMVRYTNENKISALSITHDMTSLKRIGDKVGLLHNGKIIWEGKKDELEKTENPYMRQFMNGKTSGPFTT